MAKKRRTNDRPGRAKAGTTAAVAPPAVHDDPVPNGKEAKVEVPVVPDHDDDDDDDIVPPASGGDDVNTNSNIYDDLRRSLSGELLSLTSSNSGYSSLAKFMLPHDIYDANDERGEMKRRLISTSVKLFRHIEVLAHVEDGLRRAFERRRERRRGMMDDDDDRNDEDKAGGGWEEEAEEEEGGGANGDEEGCCILSGIPSLYVGGDDDAVTYSADAETMWGQVDMQNDSLVSLLKKRVRELAKRRTNGGGDDDESVRILRAMEDDSGEDDDGVEDEDEVEDEVENGEESNDDEEDDDDDDDDEGRRRIRERMKRAMADMYGDVDPDDVHNDSDNDDDDDDDDDDRKIDVSLNKTSPSSEDVGDDDDDAIIADNDDNDDDEGVDPTREEMLDGFFDLHEMEAFADEEEEMLPDDAFGEEYNIGEDDDDDVGAKTMHKKDKEGGVLHHIRDRMGDGSEGDDDEHDSDNDEEDLLSKRYQPTTVRRKKYRPDDEVEALYKMYEGVENDDGGYRDDQEAAAADASTLTAADLFGKPSKTLMKKYKAERNMKVKNGGTMGRGGKDVKKAKVGSVAGENDDDSWDDHHFGEDGMDWKDDGEDDEEENDDDDDGGINDARKSDQHDNSDDDYEEQMNDNDDGKGIDRKDKRKLSAHDIRSQKLQQQTLRLEEDMMAEKPWKMMGEARGINRATDSLLDSTPEFEVAFKPPPILTPQHAADIEMMIKKRIIDEDWDDVIPRELPDIGAHKRGGGDAPEVSQEKSKLGLGELYEREYLKKTAGYDRDAHEKQTEEDAAKDEMKRLFANLCSQLDALSNYHFAPRPVSDEADVQNREDVPAIAMEEVLPLHVSRSRGVAPEEVHAAGRGRKSVLKGESEVDQAERRRLRSAKKAARRKSRQQKHADEKLISKLQPGLGLNNPYEKRKLREELQMARASGKVVVAADNGRQWNDEAAAGKEYQTSTKFFAKMQENVDSMIHSDGSKGDGRAKKKRKGLEAGHASSVYRL